MGYTTTESEAMITPPPGHTAHHDGDGCTGQPRPITPEAARHIAYRARRIIARAHQGDWPEAINHADWVADHYGPPGEYHLSTLLAGHINWGARPGHPQLALSIPARDPEAAALFEHLASHRRLTSTPPDQCRALGAVRVPLQTFVMFLHVGDNHAARRHWLNLHKHATANPLIPPAFATLLITWAARTAFDSRQNRARTAPLN